MVDLPEPDWPSSASNSPSYTATSMSCNTFSSWPLLLMNDLLTAHSSAMAGLTDADSLAFKVGARAEMGMVMSEKEGVENKKETKGGSGRARRHCGWRQSSLKRRSA